MSSKLKYEFLLAEKDLFSIYLQARKFPESRFNVLSTIAVSFVLFIFALISTRELDLIRSDVEQYLWAGFLLTFSVLGFLLAGFTIFATVSKPELFLAMAEITDEKTGLPKLKTNYFIFVRVFANFFILAGLLLFLSLASGEGKFIEVSFSALYTEIHAIEWYYKFCIILVGTAYYHMVVQLKSFLFNIYHSVMTSLVWHGNDEGNE